MMHGKERQLPSITSPTTINISITTSAGPIIITILCVIIHTLTPPTPLKFAINVKIFLEMLLLPL